MYRIVVSPHLDDETICLGGSIAKWVSQGDQVEVIELFNDSTVCNEKIVKGVERKLEFSNVMRVLGSIKSTIVWTDVGYEDNSHLASIGEAVGFIEDKYPKVGNVCVYFPSNTEHQDHRFANEVGQSLMRASKSHKRFQFYEYPLPYRAFDNVLEGTYIDVTEWVDIKREALSEYKSQMRETGNMSISNIIDFGWTLGKVFGKNCCLEKIILKRSFE
jgi:LmbE family N-acetylglucosaminyl deacetylase